MTDLHHDDHEPAALDRVDHAVVAHAKPIETFHSLKLSCARRSRILSKRINPVGDTALNILRQGRQLALGRRQNLDGVAHRQVLESEAGLDALPGNALAVLRICQRLARRLYIKTVLERLEQP
jgi:hypothetical protein